MSTLPDKYVISSDSTPTMHVYRWNIAGSFYAEIRAYFEEDTPEYVRKDPSDVSASCCVGDGVVFEPICETSLDDVDIGSLSEAAEHLEPFAEVLRETHQRLKEGGSS